MFVVAMLLYLTYGVGVELPWWIGIPAGMEGYAYIHNALKSK